MTKALIALLLLLPSIVLGSETFGDISIFSVKSIPVRNDSFGYAYISVQVDATNFGKPGKVYVSLSGRNRDGYEIASDLIAGAYLDTRENKLLTKMFPVKQSIVKDIREWVVTDVKKF